MEVILVLSSGLWVLRFKNDGKNREKVRMRNKKRNIIFKKQKAISYKLLMINIKLKPIFIKRDNRYINLLNRIIKQKLKD
jgi:hypothetical protein